MRLPLVAVRPVEGVLLCAVRCHRSVLSTTAQMGGDSRVHMPRAEVPGRRVVRGFQFGLSVAVALATVGGLVGIERIRLGWTFCSCGVKASFRVL